MFDFLSKYKIFSQAILVLIVLTFASIGVGSYFSARNSAEIIAEVGKSVISRQELAMMVSQEQDRLRPQTQANPQAAEYLQTDEFKNSILNNMIERRLLLNQARSMGMMVSPEELTEVIGTVPAFFDDSGQFSVEKYERLLRAQNLMPAEFESQIEQDLLVGRLQNVITQSAIVSDSVVSRLVRQRGQQREVSQLIFSPAKYRESIEVTDEDVQKYFVDNKNLFKLPERAKVEYLVLNEESAAASVSISEDELRQSYEDRIAEFQGVEERRASHILISVIEEGSDAEKFAARSRAEELLQIVKRDPSQFGALAQEFSNDPGSAESEGDLGFVQRGLMVESFDKALFESKIGSIVGPVETQYGYHIIRIDDVKAVNTTSFEDAREDIEKGVRQSKVDETYLTAAQTFSDRVYTDYDSLAPVADELGLTIQTSDWVSRDSAGYNTLLEKPELLQAIFSAESLEEKRNTQAFEVQPKTLVAARVIEYALEEEMKYEDVSGEIKDFLKSQGALDKVVAEGESTLAAIQGGEEATGGEWSKPGMVTLVKRQGLHPEGLRAIFGVSKDELPAHVGMTIDDGRYVIFRVTKVVDLEEVTEDDLSTAKRQLAEMLMQQQMSAYIGSLRENANVRIKSDSESLK
jgi:peptidyl-prolyl cis-trans isomerase D